MWKDVLGGVFGGAFGSPKVITANQAQAEKPDYSLLIAGVVSLLVFALVLSIILKGK